MDYLDPLADGIDEMLEGAEKKWWWKPLRVLYLCSPLILILAYYYW